MESEERNFGPQPLDALMREWRVDNHDLVQAAYPEQLTHKQVQRARHGRRLTLAMMQKIARIFSEAACAKVQPDLRESFVPYLHKDLFNYAKGYDPARADLNAALYPDEKQ